MLLAKQGGERSSMRVLVTGGAGFVGSHLCDALLAQGHQVTALDNLSTGRLSNLDDRARLIVCDTAEWRTAETFDVVYHLASPASPEDYVRRPLECLRANTEGTANILRLAENWKARVIVASTSEVYGDPVEHPQTEQTPCVSDPGGPRSEYVEGKRCLEAYAAAYRARGLSVATVRLFNLYGPRMRAHDGRLIPTLLRQARDGEALTVHGDGQQTRSLCWVTDAVDALVRLGGSRFSGAMNIGNPEELTVLNISRRVRELFPDCRITQTEARPSDPARRCPDVSLAQRVLSWSPATTLEGGLSELTRDQ